MTSLLDGNTSEENCLIKCYIIAIEIKKNLSIFYELNFPFSTGLNQVEKTLKSGNIHEVENWKYACLQLNFSSI